MDDHVGFIRNIYIRITQYVPHRIAGQAPAAVATVTEVESTTSVRRTSPEVIIFERKPSLNHEPSCTCQQPASTESHARTSHQRRARFHSSITLRQCAVILGLILLWLMLYLLFTIPISNYLPTIAETGDPKQFNAYNTYTHLKNITSRRNRIAGIYRTDYSSAHLVEDLIKDIRLTMHQDLFALEIERKITDAHDYTYLDTLNRYSNLRYVAVLLQMRNNPSTSSLLISSHYDSNAMGEGTYCAAMVAIMIEAVRAITHSTIPIQNSIIFLFNGATESPLQSSYDFIGYHRWGSGSRIKAFINLESIGNGNREVLFRSDSPWLTYAYCSHVVHPYANSFLDALRYFQIIPPMDTDSYIFRRFKQIQGIELMYIDDGYKYRTVNESIDDITLGSLQCTGENLIAVAHGILASDELVRPSIKDNNYSVYYDFWHWFIVRYSSTTAQCINYGVSLLMVILVAVSLKRMSVISNMEPVEVLVLFAIILGIQCVSMVFVYIVAIVTAIVLDACNNSMSWYSNRWLVFGLYGCPALIVQIFAVWLFFKKFKKKTLDDPYILMMFMHAQSIIFVLKCFILTFKDLPYAYVFMLALVFYLCPLALNLATRLHDKGYRWVIVLLIFQIISYLYFTYLFHTTIRAIIPMMGRSDPEINPDLFIASLVTMGTILAMSFIVPLFNMFRYGLFVLIGLLLFFLICLILAFTSVGFPYRAETSPGRLTLVAGRHDGFGGFDNSKLFFFFEDRRLQHELLKAGFFEGAQNLNEICKRHEQDCDHLPVHSYFLNMRTRLIFYIDFGPSDVIIVQNVSATYEFVLRSTHFVVAPFLYSRHVNVIFRPVHAGELERYLIDSVERPTSLAKFISLASGMDAPRMTFEIYVKTHNNEPTLEFILHHFYSVTNDFELNNVAEFLDSLPGYVDLIHWIGMVHAVKY